MHANNLNVHGIAKSTLYTPVQCLFAGIKLHCTGQEKVQKQDSIKRNVWISMACQKSMQTR